MYSITIIFILIISNVIVITADCPPADVNDGSVTDFVFIPEQNYDRNYTSYREDRRPLGYSAATVYYNTDTPNPCIKITDARARMFEVMIQTTPPSSICIKKSKRSEKHCSLNTLRDCGIAPSNTVYLEILCDNCEEEVDVNLWYRIRMSNKTDKDIENWCSERIQEYPEDLKTIVLPASFTFPPDGKPINGVTKLHPNNIVLTFLFIILAQIGLIYGAVVP